MDASPSVRRDRYNSALSTGLHTDLESAPLISDAGCSTVRRAHHRRPVARQSEIHRALSVRLHGWYKRGCPFVLSELKASLYRHVCRLATGLRPLVRMRATAATLDSCSASRPCSPEYVAYGISHEAYLTSLLSRVQVVKGRR